MHWEGYNDHFRTMMQGMLVSKENSDITFVCDDFQTIKAHKNILSASFSKDVWLFSRKCNVPLHEGNKAPNNGINTGVYIPR